MTPSSLKRERLRLLVEQFRHGDSPESSFRLLVEACYPAVRGFFRKRGMGEDASDLTQETFVRIYTGLHGYKSQSNFETWLFTVATNVYLRHIRDGRAQKRGAGEVAMSLEDRVQDPVAPESGPLEKALANEQQERLRLAVNALPSKMRTVLKLSLYQSRSRQEIADALDISTETVKAHLNQARRRLASVLKPEEPTKERS